MATHVAAPLLQQRRLGALMRSGRPQVHAAGEAGREFGRGANRGTGKRPPLQSASRECLMRC